MSATIKYKGETIATASNNTKTLLTAGKYMEANVVVTDNGGGGGATLQTKSVSYTPSETAISDSVTPDPGYDGMDQVNVSVGAIDSNYVGSSVPRKTYTDMTITVDQGGATVTAPAGYYASNASETIQYCPSPFLSGAEVQNDGSIYVDMEISAGGYIDQDTYPLTKAGAVTVRTSSDLTSSGATVTAPAGFYTSAASKAIPNASTPTIDSSTVDSTGKVTVDVEINSGGYIGAGTYQATDSVALPTQAAQTIYPSSSDQSIASGKYLTGAQTIKGVTYSGLDASNIKKDVVVKIGDSADDDRIVSVTGTYEGGGGGGVTWGEIGSTSVTPSARNLYAALADSSIEFGSFTLASTPSNAFVDLFTLTSITAPCKGIVIIDDAFYQGASGLPNNGNSEAISYAHFSKAFLNPAKENALASASPCYGYTIWTVSQTITAAAAGGVVGANPFDGTTGIQRGYFKWNGQTLQWKSQYGGQQYTTFVAGRTYRWIAY